MALREPIKKISIIIPVYNEEKTLAEILKKIDKLSFGEIRKEIIVIDDASKDSTPNILKNYSEQKGFKVLRNSKNLGKTRTVKRGVLLSTGDVVVTQDADLEYEPEDLRVMLDKFIKDDLDVVYGNRFGSKLKNKGPNYLGNKFVTFFSNIFTSLRGFTVPDMETCYKMIRGDVSRNISKTIESKDNFSIEPEVTAKLSQYRVNDRKLRVGIVDIYYYPRTSAEGKHLKALQDGVKAFLAIIKFNLRFKLKDFTFLLKKLLNDRSLLLLILICILMFLINYKMHPAKPSYDGITRGGWFAWCDQRNYLQIATDLSNFTLNRRFLYGLGYPVLAAPFIRLYPKDPFLIPNLSIFVISISLIFCVMRKYLKSGKYAFLGALLLIFATPLLDSMIVPWNSTVNVISFAIILYFYFKPKLNYLAWIIIAFCFAWIFSARYVDIVFIAPMLLFLLIKQSANFKSFVLKSLLFCFSFIIFIAPILFVHHRCFGSIFKTPYIYHTTEDNVSDQDLSRYSLEIVPDSLRTVFFGDRNYDIWKFRPLFREAPIFILCPLSLVYLLKRKRLDLLMIVFCMVLSFIFYASFGGFNGGSLQFGCLHYVKMWFPPLVLFTMFSIKEFLQKT
ncbi:glycosyltransferase [Candidatus Dojkabacteria bacterium]|nr:glycosyltransferase [Candidatus Dojkabacteria bacterium]